MRRSQRRISAGIPLRSSTESTRTRLGSGTDRAGTVRPIPPRQKRSPAAVVSGEELNQADGLTFHRRAEPLSGSQSRIQVRFGRDGATAVGRNQLAEMEVEDRVFRRLLQALDIGLFGVAIWPTDS